MGIGTEVNVRNKEAEEIIVNDYVLFCEEVEKIIERLYSSYDSPHLAFSVVYPRTYRFYVQIKERIKYGFIK